MTEAESGESGPAEPFDAETTVHAVLGTRVGTTTEGPEDAPAIFLVPGVPGTTRDYRYLAPLLSERLRVHRLDLPGYGSAAGASWHDYTPEGRARLVIAAADVLGAERFAVAGHSMGGPAAIATAAMVPHRITGLVTICSVGLRRHRGMALPPMGARALRHAATLPILGSAILRRSRKLYRKMRFPTADTMTRDELRRDLATVMGIDFLRARKRAEAVRAKALVAYALDDPLLEPEVEEELARTIPDAETAVYDTGGHNIQKHQARDLARRIIALLV
jgi:pimeloyl-ACP methyl ester carboxylesterase